MSIQAFGLLPLGTSTLWSADARSIARRGAHVFVGAGKYDGYLDNDADGGIGSYGFDGASSPPLSLIAAETFADHIDRGALDLAVHPGAALLYATRHAWGNRFESAILTLSIAADGTLSLLQSVGTQTDHPGRILVLPTGEYLLAGTSTDSRIYTLPIGADGMLSDFTSVWSTGGDTRRAYLHPAGTYFAQPDGGAMHICAIGADGALAEIAGSPFALAAPGNGRGCFSPDGSYLYQPVQDGGIQIFAVNEGGALTAIGASPIAVPTNFNVMAAARKLPFVFAAESAAGALHGWSIGGAGALSALPGSPYALPSDADSYSALWADDDNVFFVDSSSATLSAFAVPPLLPHAAIVLFAAR